jgi:nucleotidyltransferase/DNA polymerase involved in DNA repair
MKQSEVPQFTILRKVVHIYIDDFFALVEQSASASRRHTPLIVVGEHPQNKVEAVSPAARALGLAPGMARYQALKHAPHILCIKPDREKISPYRTTNKHALSGVYGMGRNRFAS